MYNYVITYHDQLSLVGLSRALITSSSILLHDFVFKSECAVYIYIYVMILLQVVIASIVRVCLC